VEERERREEYRNEVGEDAEPLPQHSSPT